MRLYRIGKSTHAQDLTGLGAKLHGGRWNHTGIPCIYLAESRALSLLEYAAHASLDNLPPALTFTTFEVPEDSIRQLTANELPISWLHQPYSKDSQDIGSALLTKQDFLLLKIPSVIIAGEYNFVLNTLHPLINAVKVIDVANY